jgi:uncharacterized membrane protein YcaP (DUF421 family)
VVKTADVGIPISIGISVSHQIIYPISTMDYIIAAIILGGIIAVVTYVSYRGIKFGLSFYRKREVNNEIEFQ